MYVCFNSIFYTSKAEMEKKNQEVFSVLSVISLSPKSMVNCESVCIEIN